MCLPLDAISDTFHVLLAHRTQARYMSYTCTYLLTGT